MIKCEHQLPEETYKVVVISDSQENTEIEYHLLALKFHQSLKLYISLNDQHKIELVSKCLSELTHLNGLHIIFNTNSLKDDNTLERIFNSLKSYQALTDFTLDIQDQPQQQNNSQVSSQIEDLLSSLPQLEKLQLKISNHYHNQEQENIQPKNMFQTMKYLKDLKLNMQYSNFYSLNRLNQILTDFDSAQSMRSFDFKIKDKPYQEIYENYYWPFDQLINLNELTISIKFIHFQLERFNEYLKQLKALRKVNIKIYVENQLGINELFNTLLNSTTLEELIFSLKIDEENFSISIGEEVCQDSILKILKLKFPRIPEECEPCHIVFGQQIQNIKHLETLYLSVHGYHFSNDSFEVLSTWKDQWKQLEDFQFEYYGNQECENAKFLRDCFLSVQSIKQLTIDLDFNVMEIQTSFLNGLAQLNNLERLTCWNLCQNSHLDIQNQYRACFEGLKQLKQLTFNYIYNENEMFCLTQSLESLTGLVFLDISLDMSCFDNCELFCQNLRFLKNLKEFHFQCYLNLNFNIRIFKIEYIRLIAQSLSALQNLKILTFWIPYKTENKGLYATEGINFLSELKMLTILKMNFVSNQVAKNRIKRRFKRLVYTTN